MNHSLRVALCHSATRRAHLAGAEATELEHGIADMKPAAASRFLALAAAGRRRYWREVSAAARLSGMPWPEAEALGVEPPAPVSTSQEV